MNDQEFIERLNEWKKMPDFITDARDFQLVKTRPYPGELKAEAFQMLYESASPEQRRNIPFLFQQGEFSAVYAIDVLCELFLNSIYEEQRQLRKSQVAQAIDAGSITSYAEDIQSPKDAGKLRKALAATVMLNHNDDYRDILMGLAALWLAAAHAGINPLPYFQEAAQMADVDDPYGTGSTRDMLAHFHTFAIFKEQVEPKLPR